MSKEHDLRKIVVLAESSGRLDQIMANINTLFKVQNFIVNETSKELVQRPSVFLLGSNSLSWLLREGNHKIYIPDSVKDR